MTGPEIVQFAEALNAVFTENELSTALLRLNRKFSAYVPANLPFPKQVEELVGVANSQTWIAEFVGEVVAARGNTEAIKEFLRNNRNWDPAKNRPLAHPCDTLRVFGGRSFIGRSDLRTFLKRMSTGNSRNVLLVTGERRKVGKSYSKELVSYLSLHHQPSGIAPVDLSNDDYDPGKLAAAIAKGMRLDVTGMPGQGLQQVVRWNQELATWLIPDIPDPRRVVWWIILDGFIQRMPSEGTQDLIAQLAQRAQSTQDYKLILIDYVYSLPIAVSGFVFREKVAPLKKDEVERFLKQVHEQRHGKEPEKEELSDYVIAVYDRLTVHCNEHPELAEDQLLLNWAVTEAMDLISEG